MAEAPLDTTTSAGKDGTMSEIVQIYTGYLDLIKYLEEKFLGAVYGVYHTTPYVLIIDPATKVTTDAFVRPAVEKFNALGSTQLDVICHCGGALVRVTEIAPALSVIYTVVGRGMQVIRMRNENTRGERIVAKFKLPWSLDDDAMKEDTILLQQWLHAAINGHLTSPNCAQLKIYAESYSRTYYEKHPEQPALLKWIQRQHLKDVLTDRGVK